MIYTKKLTILPNTPIHFGLESNGLMETRLFVEVGDTVTPDTLLAQVYRSECEYKYDLETELGIKDKDKIIDNYIDVLDGQVVTKGKVLAHKSSFTGDVAIKSPYDGIVSFEKLSNKHILKVRSIPIEMPLKSGIKGVVASINKQNITINTTSIRIFSKCMVGEDTKGILKVISDPNELTDNVKGCIVFYDSIVDHEFIAKAQAVNALGVIATSFNYDVLGQNLIAIASLEGFGDIQVPFYDKIKQSDGYLAMLSPIKHEILIGSGLLIEDRKKIYVKDAIYHDSIQVFDTDTFALSGQIEKIDDGEITVTVGGTKRVDTNEQNVLGVLN